MKWLKITGLLVLMLVAMRLLSWALCWLLIKLLRYEARMAAIVSNLVAFLLFVLLLYRQLGPNESIDKTTVLFGAAVYLVYLASDFFWLPWKAAPPEATAKPPHP